jgi:Uma2 family endonuclease
MPQTATCPPPLDVETYLQGELTSEVRHEYIAGQVYAMTGVSVAHNLIACNLLTVLHAHLRGGPCRVFMSDLKLHLRTDGDDIFYYPDLMVCCQADDRARYWREQPCLIVEIASESTARIDRREKFLAYREISALEDYVVVEQDAVGLTLFTRSSGWQPQALGAEDTLYLASVGLTTPVADIYYGVEFGG